MLIWKGLGFLVGVFGFGSLVLTELVSERITNDEHFYQANGWVIGVGFLVAAVLAFILYVVLSFQKTRTLVDKETGEEVVLQPDHSFFFVPVKWWPVIFMGLATICAGTGISVQQ